MIEKKGKIIGLIGKIGVGKDEVATIIQYLTDPDYKKYESYEEYKDDIRFHFSEWEIKKFADKIKDMICVLLNCTRKQLEGRDFKEKPLPECFWRYYKIEGDSKVEISSDIFFKYKNTNKQSVSFEIVKTSPRILLQSLGTEWGRKMIHPDIWVNSLFLEYTPIDTHQKQHDGFCECKCENCGKEYLSNDFFRLCEDCINSGVKIYPNWLIPDTRFLNEVQKIKEFSGLTIKILRDNDINSSKDIQEHESENELDNYKADYTIDNNGTIEELIYQVKNILEKEKLI